MPGGRGISGMREIDMEIEVPQPLRTQAIEWHVRLRHGDDAVWEAFVEWLAEDPQHAAAYDLIESADELVDPLLPELVFREGGNDDEGIAPSPPRDRRWPLWGGAIAAAIVAALVIAPQFASGRYDVVTGPGERRVIALDAGTRIELNGSTRMTLDHKNPRFAALDGGEAFFEVRHDAAHPFAIEIGQDRVVDVGTAFNVVRDAAETRVAVAEGKVGYKADGSTIPLTAGNALVVEAVSGAARVTRIEVTTVGGWRNGRFTYSGQPLTQVASDLGRALGLRIKVSPQIAAR